MLSLLTAGIGMVRTVAKQYCLWCDAKIGVEGLCWLVHRHNVVFRGCYKCTQLMIEELGKDRADGKHAA